MESKNDGCLTWIFIISLIIGCYNACTSCTNRTTDYDAPPCGITIEYADSLQHADSLAHTHARVHSII